MFKIKKVNAHCDIPCKVYDPAVSQYSTLSIIRFIDLINEIDLSNLSLNNMMQLSRLTSVKEEHAIEVKKEISTIWGDYFKDTQIDKYPEIHSLVHSIMQDASKCKQTSDRISAEKLLNNINRFTEIFWATKDINTKYFISPYPPNLKIACPVLKIA